MKIYFGNLSPIKKVFFFLLYALSLIFFFALYLKSPTISADVYWDCIVVYIAICSGALIGFGVIFGRSDAEGFEKQLEVVAGHLDKAEAIQAQFNKINFLFLNVLGSDEISPACLMRLKAELAKGIDTLASRESPPIVSAQQAVLDVFRTQKKMALDASIYFQIAIFIGVLGSAIAVTKLIDKKEPPQPSPIKVEKIENSSHFGQPNKICPRPRDSVVLLDPWPAPFCLDFNLLPDCLCESSSKTR